MERYITTFSFAKRKLGVRALTMRRTAPLFAGTNAEGYEDARHAKDFDLAQG